jgi:hypothetical protein
MANNIQKAVSANQIKNGTSVVSTTVTGNSSVLNTYVKNTPDMPSIETKYSNRFTNGILVTLVDGGPIVAP